MSWAKSPSRSSRAACTQLSRLSEIRWPLPSTMPPRRYQPPRPRAWRNFQSGRAWPSALTRVPGPLLTGTLAQASTMAGASDLQYSVQARVCFIGSSSLSNGGWFGQAGQGRLADLGFGVAGQWRQEFERGIADGGQAHPPLAVAEQLGGEAGQGALGDDGADFRFGIVGQHIEGKRRQTGGDHLAHLALAVFRHLGELAVGQAAGHGGAYQVIRIVQQAMQVFLGNAG